MAEAGTKKGEKAAAGDDQSMEEILQSIRKIIAEEGDAPTEEGADEALDEPAGDLGLGILELTDMVQDDGSVVSLQVDEGEETASDDVLNSIDDALEDDTPEGDTGEDTLEEDFVPEAVAIPEEEPEEDSEYAMEMTEGAPPLSLSEKPSLPDVMDENDTDAIEEEGLLSAASLAASAEALKALRQPTGLGDMPFVSGNTVEGLVMQLLRPMLKEWLDTNLPTIVQNVVEKEVRRITSSMNERK